MLFGEILEKQLILKNIITSEEWSQIKDKVHYKFEKDHYYTEFKQQETLSQRVDLARNMEEYVGNYYSREFFRKNILRQTEEEIKKQDDQIEKEKKDGDFEGDMTIGDI